MPWKQDNLDTSSLGENRLNKLLIRSFSNFIGPERIIRVIFLGETQKRSIERKKVLETISDVIRYFLDIPNSDRYGPTIRHSLVVTWLTLSHRPF